MYYNTDIQYHRQKSLQHGLSKQQTREITDFLSLGLDGLSLSKKRELSRVLQIKKERKIMRTRALKIMRPLLRGRKLVKKIVLMLERSGLSLQQQRVLLKKIQKLLRDFGRGVHKELDLRGLNLQMLPLSLRRFIIALQVLKAEIVHLFRLGRERDFRRIQLERMPKISVESRRKGIPLKMDFRDVYATGISRTLGSYEGRLSVSRSEARETATFARKATRNRADFSKRTRNSEQNKSKNYKKYQNKSYHKSNDFAKSNSRDYYRGNLQQYNRY